MEEYDLIVIGSGSGNAIPEVFRDKKIALIEKGIFGGTCLNSGCIPSKMFIVPGYLANSIKDSQKLGIDSTLNAVSWDQIRNRVFGIIDPISESGESFRANDKNLTYIRGEAKFVSNKILEVDGRKLTAKDIVIAVGSRPSVPKIEGLDSIDWNTSDDIMRLEQFPQSIGIVGGGYIGAEMAHIFSSYGAEVHLINKYEYLLPNADHEISLGFTSVFGERINHYPEKYLNSVSKSGEKIKLHIDNEEITVERLLLATGRTRNSDTLDLDATDITYDQKTGRIAVDEYMRTNIEGIWALGDVANPYMLKHVANREAAVVFHNVSTPDDLKAMSYLATPSAVFTDPQIASVGLTEDQARADGIKFTKGTRYYSQTAYGWALNDETSFAKVIVDKLTKEILGCHIMGPEASMIIQPVIQAMTYGQSAEEISKNVYYIHPALTEVIENALLDALNDD